MILNDAYINKTLGKMDRNAEIISNSRMASSGWILTSEHNQE